MFKGRLKAKEDWTDRDEMVGWHLYFDGHGLSKLCGVGGDEQGRPNVAVHGVTKKSNLTDD